MAGRRKIWTANWAFKEGLIIGVGLFITGISLEYFTMGRGVKSLMEFPFNIYFLVGLLILTLLLWFTARKIAITQWLGSVPAAVSSISLFLIMGLIMGLNMQTDQVQSGFLHFIGFTHISTSWPYMFSVLFLLLSLGITCLKNIFPLNKSKLGFTVSHLGLFVVLISANFGGSQLVRLEMELQENRITTYATNKSDNQVYNLPFAVKLNDFILDEYNPKLTIVNNISGEMIHGNGKNIITIDSSIKFKILKYKIEILNYIESAVKAGDKYYFNNEPGACPAAHVNVTFEDGHQIQAWLSCGSYNRQFESLKLDSQNSLVMLFPEPKLFVSEIQLFNKKGDITNAKLEVNKPFNYDQFKIYQLSYDSNLGKWSDTSVIELIYDPWLPYVYIGIFLMIIGAIYMLFTGAVKKK